MRIVRVVVLLSALALSMQFIEFAAAQAPGTKPPATAKPAKPKEAKAAPKVRPSASSTPHANPALFLPIVLNVPSAVMLLTVAQARNLQEITPANPVAPSAGKNPSANPAKASRENQATASPKNQVVLPAKNPSANLLLGAPENLPAPSTNSKATKNPSVSAPQLASSKLKRIKRPIEFDDAIARKLRSYYAS